MCPVIKDLRPSNLHIIERWIKEDNNIDVNYPDNTSEILDMVLEKHLYGPAREKMTKVPA